MTKKIKKALSDSWEALTFPDNIDTEWDDQCDSNFGKFLDILYYVLAFLIILYPTVGAIVLLTQNYGK